MCVCVCRMYVCLHIHTRAHTHTYIYIYIYQYLYYRILSGNMIDGNWSGGRVWMALMWHVSCPSCLPRLRRWEQPLFDGEAISATIVVINYRLTVIKQMTESWHDSTCAFPSKPTFVHLSAIHRSRVTNTRHQVQQYQQNNLDGRLAIKAAM